MKNSRICIFLFMQLILILLLIPTSIFAQYSHTVLLDEGEEFTYNLPYDIASKNMTYWAWSNSSPSNVEIIKGTNEYIKVKAIKYTFNTVLIQFDCYYNTPNGYGGRITFDLNVNIRNPNNPGGGDPGGGSSLNNGDKFYYTYDGVSMQYRVISTSDKTCMVGAGYLEGANPTDNGRAVSKTLRANSITIPPVANGFKVIEVATSAFGECSKIKEIIMPETITKIGKYSFQGCTSIMSIIIPNSVTDILEGAFSSCDFINVTLGSSVRNIQYAAFGNVKHISVINSLATDPPCLSSDAFISADIFNQATIYVPSGCLDKYRNTYGWKDFKKIKVIGGDDNYGNKIIAVSAGSRHSMIIDSNGTLWGTGSNGYGELGDDTETDKHGFVMIMDNVEQVSAGSGHSLIIKKDGSLWVCGYNRYGQLGDGTTDNKFFPVKIMDNVSSVSAGDYYSLILKKDGSLWSCGYNRYGQLGDGTTDNKYFPVKIMDNVSSVSAGCDHSLILKNDGTVWSFGYNYCGQLGNGSFENSNKPIMIMENAISVSAGSHHSCVVKNDGTLWTFGLNGNGQLGIGNRSIMNSSNPCKIMEDVAFVGKSFGSSTLIVKNDGSYWACGYNGDYNLGNGTNESPYVPIKILENVTAVAAGMGYTLIVKGDGSLWVCGTNERGQLGDGTTKAQNHLIKIKDGDPTSISKIDYHHKVNTSIYYLSGQKLIRPQKGINIINGKKVLIK